MSDNISVSEDKKHVSFSELLVMHECGYIHNQRYIKGIKQADTIFTIFGTATGLALENYKKGIKNSWISYIKKLIKFLKDVPIEEKQLTYKNFADWCAKSFKERAKATKFLHRYAVSAEPTEENFKIYNFVSFTTSALRIYKDLIAYFDELEKEWDIVAFEIPLMEEIPDIDMFFKGYIDIVLKHKTENRYKIVDFKTCSFGWTLDQKNYTEKLYQVILYKKFWCEKNLIDPATVDCAYLLLKRAPAKKDIAVEMFDITSGKVKVENANLWMLKTLVSILQEFKLKTPQTCKYCSCGKKPSRY